MRKTFHERGFEEFLYWQTNNKKIFKKISDLIKDNWQGWYSRRIDDKNWLIYRVCEDSVKIAQCKGHYDDK